MALGACDHRGKILDIVPAYDLIDSFESGLGDWTAEGVDLDNPTVAWSVAGSTEEASTGSHSVKLTLDNVNGAGKIWIERELEVDSAQAYDVTISFDLGTADYGTVNLWKVIAGAHTAPPETAAELTFRDDTGNGADSDAGVRWVSKSYTVHTRSDDDGHLYVVVGVWGTHETARSYYLDNVHLQLTQGG